MLINLLSENGTEENQVSILTKELPVNQTSWRKTTAATTSESENQKGARSSLQHRKDLSPDTMIVSCTSRSLTAEVFFFYSFLREEESEVKSIVLAPQNEFH